MLHYEGAIATTALLLLRDADIGSPEELLKGSIEPEILADIYNKAIDDVEADLTRAIIDALAEEEAEEMEDGRHTASPDTPLDHGDGSYYAYEPEPIDLGWEYNDLDLPEGPEELFI